MTARFTRLSVAVAVLGLLASPALAQMLGNPVYFSPKQAVGLTIAGEYGRGLNDNSGKGNYFGGRAILGLPKVAITAGAGSWKPEGFDAQLSFGGDVAVELPMAPAVPVAISLQAGAAYNSESGVKTIHVPLGAAVAFNVNSPGASVEPWVGPRVDIVRVSNGGSFTDTNIGASGGVNVSLPTGLGFHVALDFLKVTGGSSLTAGAGVHYNIKIPSLGPVGM